MSLLHEIQAALMEEGRGIGPILLKLRYLAARLGSDPLEEWVKHESEGYPAGVEVPEYRKLGVSYLGDFSGPFGSGIKNAPIPPFLIEKHAGAGWVNYEMRQSIAAIDDLISSANIDDNAGSLRVDASNLILLLQGKVYEDYACNSVRGSISTAALAEIQHAVRSRILELTIEIDKKIPSAGEISLGPISNYVPNSDAQTVTNITNQVIHGNITTVSSLGANAKISVQVAAGDKEAFQAALEHAGLPSEDAVELTKIVASEEAESEMQPWGKKARAWLASNIGKAADGTWKVGLDVAGKVLTAAAMKYYGLR